MCVVMEPSQYLLNCTNLSVSQLQALNLSRGASGLVCMLVASLVFALLLRVYCTTPKPGRSVLKRMVLNLTATTLVLQALLFLQFEHYFHYSGQSTVCEILGFLNQWVSSISYSYDLGITVYLLYVVYTELRRKALVLSARLKVVIEVVFYLTVVFSPLTYLWKPFVSGGYGLGLAFCWIKSHTDTCDQIGQSSRDILFGIFVADGVISVACIFAVSILYCLVCRYRQLANRKISGLLRRTLLFMSLLIARIVIAGFSHVLFPVKLYSVWMYYALFIPVTYMIVPLGFLVYVCAIRKSKKCVCCCAKRRSSFEVLEDTSALEAPTHQQSNNKYVRSYTHWSVPYTNGFTTITDQGCLNPSSVCLKENSFPVAMD